MTGSPRTEFGVQRAELKRRQDAEAAELLRLIAHSLDAMADALDWDDGIMGSLAGAGLVNHLPALPKHIRDVLAEYLTDEAAISYRADQAYMEAM